MVEEKKESQYDSGVSISTAVEDAQLMVAYIANKGPVGYSKETLDVIVESKHLVKENQLTIEAETAFWMAYKELATQIHPVTINSLKSSMSNPYCSAGKKHRRSTSKASRTASKYRVLAFMTLAALLFAQIYYIIGANVASEIDTIFKERQQVRMEMDRISILKGVKLYDKYFTVKDDDDADELNRLGLQNTLYNQKLDANYQILQKWNCIWQVLFPGNQELPEIREFRKVAHKKMVDFVTSYNKFQLSHKADATTEPPDSKGSHHSQQALKIQERMMNLDMDFEAMKARNKLLVTQISARFALISMQTYFLPLLYGLMGALMYALRMLAVEIKDLTYDTDSQIRYRLRIFIGAIAGLMIGLFINPEEIEAFNLIAPMAVSFIAGYNVELLFSTMDRIIHRNSERMKPGDTPARVPSS